MTTPTTVSVRLQLRADTAANWTSTNPTLLANELGRETDTGKIKIGDGSTAWSSLAYQAWATLPIAVASGGTGQTSYTNGQLLIGNTTGNTLTKATLTAGSGIAVTNGTGSISLAASEIANSNISATAEIAVSKLADGTARQLLQTDAAGTGVEWASNIDIPGTLDVTSAATFDSSVAVTGALTKSGSNVVTVGDTGTVTSTMILDGTILNADVNASAAIAGTKISPDFGSQTVVTTGVFSHAIGAAATPSITFTGDTNTGIYSPGADTIAFSEGGVEAMRIDSSGRLLVGTSSATTVGELLRVEKASTGTEGTGIRFGGFYSLADGATQSFTIGNGALVFISENITGDGALFFCSYKSATVTLLSDPNNRYANSDTATKICVFKSANSGTVSLKNRSGSTGSFTIGKVNNSD